MKRQTAIAGIFVVVSASAAQAQQVPAIERGGTQVAQQQLIPEQKAKPIEFPPAITPGVPVKPLTKRQARAVKLAKTRLNDRLMPTLGPDGAVTYVFGHTQPEVVCAPSKWCAVRLEVGEIVIGPSGKPDAGLMLVDTSNWWASLGASGSGKAIVTDVLISPKFPGTQSQISWGTNKGRRYMVNLRSTEDDYVPLTKFSYPDDDVRKANKAYAAAAAAAENAAPHVGDIAALDFGFDIDGDEDFRPISVYTDGRQTVLDFGRELQDLPVFVALSGGGIFSSPERTVVNTYILGDGRKMLVDGVFKRGVLVMGVGGDQREVEIEKVSR